MAYQNEKQISSQQIYDGIVVKLFKDEVELDNGYKTVREVIRHPGGVCIAALDKEENLYFVKQFRYPFKTALTELPAGKLEFGEDPRDAGLRELKEEVGAVFEQVLEDAGVFKREKQGMDAFKKFCLSF